MTQTSPEVESLLDMDFDALPPENRVRAYGVDYAHLVLNAGGELYLTRFGWNLSRMVVPQAWFTEQRFAREGKLLTGSTGTVYRVPALKPIGATSDLVVKFCRVAQDVPLFVDKPLEQVVPRDMVDAARFNDPFEEFGLVMELRRGPFGPSRPRILTKRPLAIYSPAHELALWQLGRHKWQFEDHVKRLEVDQKDTKVRRAELHLLRDYILAFQWVKGDDAELMHKNGGISKADMLALYDRSNAELTARGFVMLDNKPRHLILREFPGKGGLVRHGGEISYALIDFELLKRRV